MLIPANPVQSLRLTERLTWTTQWLQSGSTFTQQVNKGMQWLSAQLPNWSSVYWQSIPSLRQVYSEVAWEEVQQWQVDLIQQLNEFFHELIDFHDSIQHELHHHPLEHALTVLPIQHLTDKLLLLRENLLSPAFYDRQLTKLIKRFDQHTVFSPAQRHYYQTSLHRLQQQWRDALYQQPTQAIDYFYDDVLQQVIGMSGKDYDLKRPTVEQVLGYLYYYQGLVPEQLYNAVKIQLKHFAAQYERESDGLFTQYPEAKVYQQLWQTIGQLFEAYGLEETSNASNAALRNQAVESRLIMPVWHVSFNSKGAVALLSLAAVTWAAAYSGQSILSSTTANLSTWPSLSHGEFNAWGDMQGLSTLLVHSSFSYGLMQKSSRLSLTSHTALPLLSSWILLLPTTLAQTIDRPVTPSSFISTWGGIDWDLGTALQVVSDGYVVTGTTGSFGAGNYNALLQKWALNGTLLWTKAWNGTGNDGGNALQVVSDGYVVTGSVIDKMLLQKWSLNGKLLWTKTWSGSDSDSNYGDQGIDLQVVPDGYVVTGYTVNFITGAFNMLLQKWSLNGTLLWAKAWSGSGADYGAALQVVSDGYVVTGYTRINTGNNYDVLLQKWSVNGTLLWTKTWGGANWDQGFALQVVSDGYVVTGYTNSFGVNVYDGNVLLQKWSLNGTLLWTKMWGGTNDEGGRALQVVSDGYVVTGYTRSFGGGYDVLLQKWTLNGTLLWTKTWGGIEDDVGNALQVVSDGYVVTGYTKNFGAGNGDVLLQKWDLNGNLLNCMGVFRTVNVSATALIGTVGNVVGTVTTPNTTAQAINNGTLKTLTILPRSLCNNIATTQAMTRGHITTGRGPVIVKSAASARIAPSETTIGMAGALTGLLVLSNLGFFASCKRRSKKIPLKGMEIGICEAEESCIDKNRKKIKPTL